MHLFINIFLNQHGVNKTILDCLTVALLHMTKKADQCVKYTVCCFIFRVTIQSHLLKIFSLKTIISKTSSFHFHLC